MSALRSGIATAVMGLMGLTGCATTMAPTASAIDNASIGQPAFREHRATYGLVYRLPKDVTDVLDNRIYPPLRERLVHNADPGTPRRMLAALKNAPPVLAVTLKTFYNTEAAAGAGAPWWFDLGIVKSGQGYTDMMAYNVVATAALTPLRDGPLPRVTGPVYAKMGDAAKELVQTVGVSGVNVMKDGKPTASHNPHNTLVYSMTPYDARVQAAMKNVADEMNRVLPDGINTQFRDVSIVEIGFMGNVVREFYRISLADGSAWDTTSGKAVVIGR